MAKPARHDNRIAADACPACGARGRKVKRVTLESLLRPDRRADIGDGPYHVCLTPECETVYFGAGDATTFVKSDLSVRFGLKESDSPRPVCYCFDHSIEGIQDEICRTGRSTVLDSIKAAMKGPGCRCEFLNPLGGCCLKTVEAVVADAFRSIGNQEPAATVAAVDHKNCCADNGHASKDDEMPADCCATPNGADERTAATSSDCCQTPRVVPADGPGRDRAGTLAAGGSVVAAILSSACCWLPLVLIAFGVSAAGVAGFFEAYRPYFIFGAVGLLGFGFYMVYFHKGRCAPGSACAAPNRKLKTFNQVMLWTATALVGAFVFFPNYVGYLLAAPTQENAVARDSRLATVRFHIEGMTCEGCATGLRNTLAELPDVASVEVDYPTETAVVRYAADNAQVADQVVEAVQTAGYHAAPVEKR